MKVNAHAFKLSEGDEVDLARWATSTLDSPWYIRFESNSRAKGVAIRVRDRCVTRSVVLFGSEPTLPCHRSSLSLQT